MADEDRKLKGRRLGDYTADELNDIIVAALDEPERFASLIAVASRVLDRKVAAGMGSVGGNIGPDAADMADEEAAFIGRPSSPGL